MGQLAKTIYFSDYPQTPTGRSGLTVPFPEGCQQAYSAVVHLSSCAIRELLGYESFAHLQRDASAVGAPTATFARDLLLQRAPNRNHNPELSLQATFKGGSGSPLHDWYPYLEGYSPAFVGTIIDSFCPSARVILDPFSGSGTTPLVAAIRGLHGLYAEVNPVCRYVTAAKLSAINHSVSVRTQLSAHLEHLASELEVLVAKTRPCPRLKQTFSATFGDSKFFDDLAFDRVMRCRSICDRVTDDDPLVGQFVEIAILRSLVPGSLLVRRGDLRFRTSDELRRNPPNFVKEVCQSLRLVASDLHDAPFATGAAYLISDDARRLPKDGKRADAIITSPPYLNGTNYFRNTKIELWFTRDLEKRSQLRSLRDAAITAGINDVTARKASASRLAKEPRTLKKVLGTFDGNTYDVRIPLMVQSYFGEMGRVLDGFPDVISDDGTVAIDLGDSCYGNVWVPTDRIFRELMEQRGFELSDRVVLRERKSRDGRKLSQTLQIFRRRKRASSTSLPRKSAHAPSGWTTFKKSLPHQTGAMAARNWGHRLHSLCSYQGKLKPALAHCLIQSLLPGKRLKILDPFAGVGTIPFEARLVGHLAYAFEISPAALAITRAKIEHVELDSVEYILRRLALIAKSADSKNFDLQSLNAIRFNGALPTYFHPQTLTEIVAVRDYFAEHPPNDGAHALVFSAMLHILHGNRPYALSRRSHPITPFAPTGPAHYKSVIEKLRAKVSRSLDTMLDTTMEDGLTFFQDATRVWPSCVTELDAVITSPPFFDSTRFHTANWMRLWFAGWEKSDFQSKPANFIDERQKISFDVYKPFFRQCRERVRPGAVVLMHLGKSSKCDMAKALLGVASEFLDHVDTFTESVQHCERHGIRDKGTVTDHQYLLMRRPT